jgi:hypothetical protein
VPISVKLSTLILMKHMTTLLKIARSETIKFLFPTAFVYLSFSIFANFITAQTTALKFEVTIARGLISAPQKGRLFVFLNRKGENEPRLDYQGVGLDAPPMLAKDVENFAPGSTKIVINNEAISHPIKNLSELPWREIITFKRYLKRTRNCRR